MATGSSGTILHRLIEQWTGRKPELGCGCQQWINKMDRDHEWAKANVPLITKKLVSTALGRKKDWKVEQAKAGGRFLRGIFRVVGAGVFLEPFCRSLVEQAIKESEDGASGS